MGGVNVKKKAIISIAVVVLLIAGLNILAAHPIVSCKLDVPEDYMEAIESQSNGVYSAVLPLVPVYVSVDSFSTNRVCYTVYYFPFGAVGMSYTEGDGYNIEKPLTNQ